MMAFMSHYPLSKLFSLSLLFLYVRSEFRNPPSIGSEVAEPKWELGTTETISWQLPDYATDAKATLAVWVNNVGYFLIYDTTHTEFNWTVDAQGQNLSSNPDFYFAIYDPGNTTAEAESVKIKISNTTTPSSTATLSSTTKSSTSTTHTSTSETISSSQSSSPSITNTPSNSSSSDQGGLASSAKIGIGVGVGIGVPVILVVGFLLGRHYARKYRSNATSKTEVSVPCQDQIELPAKPAADRPAELTGQPSVSQPVELSST